MWRHYLKGLATALALMSVPAAALADRGEGSLSLGISGNLSFFNNPLLKHESGTTRPSSATLAVQSGLGIGVTDWLEVGLIGRAFLPSRVAARDVSAQGFPSGEAVYDTLAIQAPLAVTARYDRGGSATMGLALEVGVEWAHWTLVSLSASSTDDKSFGIEAQDEWSTSLMLGLEPTIDWRPFNHFALRGGPRFIVTTGGTMHVGMSLSGNLMWGLGVF